MLASFTFIPTIASSIICGCFSMKCSGLKIILIRSHGEVRCLAVPRWTHFTMRGVLSTR